jgi:hypothetical protein
MQNKIRKPENKGFAVCLDQSTRQRFSYAVCPSGELTAKWRLLSRRQKPAVCRGLLFAVRFQRISPCALFCRESRLQSAVGCWFAVCSDELCRVVEVCRGLAVSAHGKIFSAVCLLTA